MAHELKTTQFNKTLVGFIVEHPYWSMLMGLLLVAASAMGAGRLQTDFTHRGYLWDDDPTLIKFDSFEKRFGNDDMAVVAIHSPSGVFDPETAALIKEFTERMWHVPEIIRVDSLANYNWVHAEGDDIQVEPLLPEELTAEVLEQRRQVALAHEVLPDYLVSRDGNTALVFARIKPGLDKPSDSPLVYHSIEKLAEEFKRGDHALYVSGSPAVIASFAEIAEKDTGRIIPIALLVAIVALALLLRTVLGVVLPLVLIVLCVLSVFGFAGWTGIKLSNMSTAVPSILLAACIADAMHILVTFYEARRTGLVRKEAARYSLSKNLLPTFLTSTTTALGFFSFASVNVKPISGLGFMVGYGALLAWVLTYLLIGGAIVALPMRTGRVAPEAAERDYRLAGRYLDLLLRRRMLITVGWVLIAVASVWLATKNEVNSDAFKYFGADVPVRMANEFVEKEVGGARGVELIVNAGSEDGIKDPAFLKKVDELQTWIQQQKGVTRAVSIVDVLKAMHRSLNGEQAGFYRLADDRDTIGQELFLYSMNLPQGMDLNDRMTLANDALRITVMWTISNSRDVIATTDAIEAKARALGLDLEVTGKYHLFDVMNGYVVNSFLTSFFTAAFTIALVIGVVLRSFKLTVISLIPNILPVLIGGAILKLIGQPLDIGTVIVASVCLGIAVDDTIHVLANFQRERESGLVPAEAMRNVLARHARPLLVTTIILVTSFGAFAIADFTPNLFFGVLTAAILALALLVDLTLTPLLLVTGKAEAKDSKAAAAAAAA